MSNIEKKTYTKDELKTLFTITSKNINWLKNNKGSIKLSVLVVDDERSFRELLRDVLEEEGIDVVISKNGLAGFHEFEDKKNNFDVILTDIMMDTLTGVEMADKIRKVDPNQKIIFISGWFSREQLVNKFEEEFEEGKFLFYIKPLNMDNLIETLYIMKNQENSSINFELNTLEFEDIRKIFDKLDVDHSIVLHKEIWNLTIQLFLDILRKKFKRKDLYTLLEPTSDYLKRKGCDEDEVYCRGNECLSSSPDCVKEKLLTQLKVINELLNKIYSKVK